MYDILYDTLRLVKTIHGHVAVTAHPKRRALRRSAKRALITRPHATHSRLAHVRAIQDGDYDGPGPFPPRDNKHEPDSGSNVLQQQACFDAFVHQFNHERPHQALDMATPASRYQPSTRAYQAFDALEYPRHDWTAVITTCGRICYQRRKVNVSQVFVGQKVGVKQTDDHMWLVTFMDYDLGYFDDETCRLEPIDDPFGSKL